MKKLVLLGIVGAVFALMAGACSHSGDATSPTTTTIGAPAVVINSSTIKPTTTTIESSSTTPVDIEASNINTKWVITAKVRPLDSEGRTPSKLFPVYDAPGGDELDDLRDYVSGKPRDPTPWNARLTFLVISTADEKGNKYPGGRPQDEWAEVILSTRPNNTRAWIRTADFDFQRHEFEILIDISDKKVTVYEGTIGEKMLVETTAIIGKPSTPTPVVVKTYIDAKVRNEPSSKTQGGFGIAYGTWIFTLAAFSDVLPKFQGNIPQLAIHGTNIPSQIGQALSSGCIRIPNEVIDLMAEKLIVGTPVTIVA